MSSRGRLGCDDDEIKVNKDGKESFRLGHCFLLGVAYDCQMQTPIKSIIIMTQENYISRLWYVDLVGN